MSYGAESLAVTAAYPNVGFFPQLGSKFFAAYFGIGRQIKKDDVGAHHVNVNVNTGDGG